MMEQLLVFSRVQQRELDRAPLNAMAAIEIPMLQLGRAAQAAGAKISVEPLGQVYADPDLFALAFTHILDNAIKFRRPDVSPRITIQPAHDEVMWRMRVADNGLGVMPAYRDKAFRMFHRLNGEGAFPGIGAGLTICRRIARRHGGDVVFLDRDEGACLELSLPRAAPQP